MRDSYQNSETVDSLVGMKMSDLGLLLIAKEKIQSHWKPSLLLYLTLIALQENHPSYLVMYRFLFFLSHLSPLSIFVTLLDRVSSLGPYPKLHWQ
jgi:hypothetical protein